MFPGPVPGHHIAVLLLLAVEFLICRIVDVAFKIWTSKEVLNDFTRVPIPDVMVRGLPLWKTSRFGEGAVILQVNIFPPDIAHLNCVNLAMEIPVVGDGRQVTMGNKCGGPQLKKVVNLSSRKLCICEHEFRKFKPSSGLERGPIAVGFHGQGFWWNAWRDKFPMLVTPQACEE